MNRVAAILAISLLAVVGAGPASVLAALRATRVRLRNDCSPRTRSPATRLEGKPCKARSRCLGERDTSRARQLARAGLVSAGDWSICLASSRVARR
jgi:hypothetical protein